jgi:hypothetical protein
MLTQGAQGGQIITVEANVVADLAGKEGFVVEQVAASKKVQLFTNGIPFAVLKERLQGAGDWSAYEVQGGGLVPCVAGGAINSPDYVKPANGGKLVAATTGNLACGVKRSPVTAAADGDIILVQLGTVTVP